MREVPLDGMSERRSLKEQRERAANVRMDAVMPRRLSLLGHALVPAVHCCSLASHQYDRRRLTGSRRSRSCASTSTTSWGISTVRRPEILTSSNRWDVPGVRLLLLLQLFLPSWCEEVSWFASPT